MKQRLEDSPHGWHESPAAGVSWLPCISTHVWLYLPLAKRKIAALQSLSLLSRNRPCLASPAASFSLPPQQLVLRPPSPSPSSRGTFSAAKAKHHRANESTLA